MRKNKRYPLYLLTLIITLYIILKLTEKRTHVVTHSFIFNRKLESTSSNEFILHSDCYCQKDIIHIKNIDDKFYKITIRNYQQTFYTSYNLTKQKFESLALTCNLYNVLRKGPNQNVLSYSIYSVPDTSKDDFLNQLGNRLQFVKLNYKDWRIRVYHDNSLEKSVICEKQCLKDTNDDLYDNIDFCGISQMPVSVFNVWNADYIMPDLWKWLPLGDDFVDRVAPRNKDACLLTREVDAVNEWVKSRRMFHIMRDHPSHDKVIIDGQWGMNTRLDRSLARYLFSVTTDKQISELFQSENKFQDEILKDYFWREIKFKSIFSHDSYHCERYESMSFPSKRTSNCYIGSTSCCKNNNDDKQVQVCPEACRPLSYTDDWIFC